MTLPSSGQISFNDIRIELGVGSQAPLSITSASKGLYVALNTRTGVIKPDGLDPQATSEWYNYNNSPTCIECGTCKANSGCCSNSCVGGNCAC